MPSGRHAAEADEVERPVEDAILRQDHPPGVDPDEVRGPQREEDGDREERSPSRRRDASHVIGDRKGDEGIADRDDRGDEDRPQDDDMIDGLLEELLEVDENTLLDDITDLQTQ